MICLFAVGTYIRTICRGANPVSCLIRRRGGGGGGYNLTSLGMIFCKQKSILELMQVVKFLIPYPTTMFTKQLLRISHN